MNNQSGQVLLITVLVLMSTFALAIGIGGLVLFNLRSNVASGESVKAIYASESCLEWQLYKINKGPAVQPTMSNKAEFSPPASAPGSIRCVGTSGRVNRALEIIF